MVGRLILLNKCKVCLITHHHLYHHKMLYVSVPFHPYLFQHQNQHYSLLLHYPPLQYVYVCLHERV